MIILIMLIVLLLFMGGLLICRKKKGMLKEEYFWPPFVAIILGIAVITQSTYKYAATVEIENKIKKFAVKTADLVALMSSYTGWEVIPVTQVRLNFYKTVQEEASELIKDSGDDPNRYQSLRALKGIIHSFKPRSEPVSRPSSDELELRAKEYDQQNKK